MGKIVKISTCSTIEIQYTPEMAIRHIICNRHNIIYKIYKIQQNFCSVKQKGNTDLTAREQ